MKQIVILGGGYAGVHAGKILHRAFKKTKDVSVTLIDKNSYHTLMTELHEVAGNRVQEDSVRISYDRIFSNRSVQVVQDEIIHLDPVKQELKSNNSTYTYDYLLMGTGAEPTDFGIPGVKENTLSLWSLNDALKIKGHIKEKFRAAAYEQDEDTRRRMLSFSVAGAGFTGVEMIGELIEWLPLLSEEYGIDKSDYSLNLVEGLGHILSMIPSKPRAKALRYLEKKGVRLILNSFISEAKSDSFTLKDGTVIEGETLIWTCGVKGKDHGKEWGLKASNMDRVDVEDNMRTIEYPNVFVVGDSQWFLENDRPIPQIVEGAEQTASVAAKNIIFDITGKGKEKKFTSSFHGFMVSIGGRYAVSHTMGLSLSGIPAMVLKHLINCYYLHLVCGANGWMKYLKHEIFFIENKRSLLGGLIAGKIQGLWAVPLRVWLGLMWLFEGLNKVGEGWLNSAKGSSSSWMFSPGVIQKGLPGYVKDVSGPADVVSAASDETVEAVEIVVETVVEAVSAASEEVAYTADVVVETVRSWGPFWDLTKPVLSWDNFVVTWFRETFMDGITAHLDFSFFQTMVVTVECLIGLALIGGLFTFPAAGVSIIMCFVFLLSGLFSWSQVWFIFVAFLLLGGSGRTLGLDYWVQPFLKRWWNRRGLAQSTYLYTGEPRRKKG